jgi:phosphonate transport system permease protein
MAQSLPRLSENRLSPLMDGYARALAARRARSVAYSVLFLVVAALAVVAAEIDGAKFLANIGNIGSYFDRILTLENGQRVWTDPAEWFWGWKQWGRLLLDTLLIAYVGTIIGAVAGFVLCFLASANLVANPWLRAVVRRVLEFSRTVPELVFALIFVIAFGLGPVPGVLALAIHTMGALGKQFYEVVENIDMKPVEGVSSTGAGWATTVRFAVVPQVLSGFLSYALVRFEINVRGAAVMGFVGAGGIGQDLLEAIRKFYYADVSALLVMIIGTVVIIDLVSERLRHRLLSMESAR